MAVFWAVRDQAQRKERLFWPRVDYVTGVNVIHPYDDTKFQEKYRVSRPMLRQLAEGYADSEWGPECARSQAISPNVQMQTAVRFLAEGCTLSTAGQLHGISTASTSRIVDKVTAYLCSLAPEHIKMPQTEDELAQASRAFHRIGGMPQTVGAVDGTHIPIIAPPEHEHAYVNRHGQHSINVQVCCGPEMAINDIVAQFPRSCHDGYVLRMSDLYDDCDRGRLAGNVILGDSAYPLTSWLMTPYLNAQNQGEINFNSAHKSCRCIVKRTIGLWKARFRCLHVTGGALGISTGTTCKAIVATAVLHNLCVRGNLPNPDHPMPQQDQQQLQHNGVGAINGAHREGLRRREAMTRAYLFQ